MEKYRYHIIKSPVPKALHTIQMDMQLSIWAEEEVIRWQETERTDLGEFEADKNVLLEKLYNLKPEKLVLTHFYQEHIEAILPYLKEHVKVLYIFKCPRLASWDFLCECKNLEVVDIYWNQKATALWDLKANPNLHTLVIDSCNKLSDFSILRDSGLKHLEIWGCNYLSSFTPKTKIDDLSIFQTMPRLENLWLAIKKNENQEKDFEDLMKLTKLKKFRIQERYFDKEKMRRLKETLPFQEYYN